MTIPVLETFTVGDGSDDARTDLTATKPAGVVAGDMLVIIAVNESNGAGPEFADDITGFTFQTSTGDGTSDVHIGVYFKQATGSEGATETVTAVTSGIWGTYYLRVSGADASAFHKFTASISTDQGTTKSVAEVTTTLDDCLIVYCLAGDGSDTSPNLTTANGWTAPGDEDSADEFILTSFPTTGVGACFGSRGLATAGGSGIASIALAVGDTDVRLQLAIAPASVGINTIIIVPTGPPLS